MRTLIIFATFMMFCSLQDLAGQNFAEIGPGERIRVLAPDCGLLSMGGSFRGVVGDSLYLSKNDADLICPLAAVERLELRQVKRRWNGGTTAGALFGAVGGAALGGLISPDGMVVGVVAGAPFGAAIGMGPRARRAALTGLGVGVVGGAALGALIGSNDDYWGPGFFAVVFGVLGAPVGALGGGVVGLLRGEEHWVAVDSPAMRPQLAVTPDGRFGFTVSVPTKR
jgi:hypothetical protein